MHDGSPRLLTRPLTLTLNEFPRAAAWSPQGEHLAVGLGDGSLAWIEPGSGMVQRRCAAHRAGILGLGWDAQGERLATSGEDGRVRIWLPSQENHYWESGERSEWVEFLAWSPGGSYLASAGGNTVQVWDRQGRRVTCLEGFGSTVSGLAWRSDSKAFLAYKPGGDVLASGSKDGELCLWNPLASDAGVRAHTFTQPVEVVAWSGNGARLAAASTDGTVALFS